MTDAHIWFGWRQGWVWQSLNNADSPYTDGVGFTGPTGCQSSRTPVTVGAHVLFISCRCGVGACGWDYMSNHSDWFCMAGVLKIMCFFWLCCLQMSLFRWNGFYVSSACQSQTLFFSLTQSLNLVPKNKVLFLLYSLLADATYGAMGYLNANYTSYPLFSWRIRTVNRRSLAFLTFFLSPPFIGKKVKPAPQWAIKRKIQYCVIPMCCCVQAQVQ